MPAAVDKRRLILDAAIRVFARQGFHACRVSDIADEAGVAYGLVYHYFGSKEEILNTLFTERWQVMLDAIAEIDDEQERAAYVEARTVEQRADVNLLRMGSDLVVDAVVEGAELRGELLARLRHADGWSRAPARRHRPVTPV